MIRKLRILIYSIVFGLVLCVPALAVVTSEEAEEILAIHDVAIGVAEDRMEYILARGKRVPEPFHGELAGQVYAAVVLMAKFYPKQFEGEDIIEREHKIADMFLRCWGTMIIESKFHKDIPSETGAIGLFQVTGSTVAYRGPKRPGLGKEFVLEFEKRPRSEQFMLWEDPEGFDFILTMLEFSCIPIREVREKLWDVQTNIYMGVYYLCRNFRRQSEYGAWFSYGDQTGGYVAKARREYRRLGKEFLIRMKLYYDENGIQD